MDCQQLRPSKGSKKYPALGETTRDTAWCGIMMCLVIVWVHLINIWQIHVSRTSLLLLSAWNVAFRHPFQRPWVTIACDSSWVAAWQMPFGELGQPNHQNSAGTMVLWGVGSMMFYWRYWFAQLRWQQSSSRLAGTIEELFWTIVVAAASYQLTQITDTILSNFERPPYS